MLLRIHKPERFKKKGKVREMEIIKLNYIYFWSLRDRTKETMACTPSVFAVRALEILYFYIFFSSSGSYCDRTRDALHIKKSENVAVLEFSVPIW